MTSTNSYKTKKKFTGSYTEVKQRKQRSQHNNINPNNSYKTKKKFTGSYTEVNPPKKWSLELDLTKIKMFTGEDKQ